MIRSLGTKTPSYLRRAFWSTKVSELTPELRDRMVAGCDEEAAGRSIADLQRQRDDQRAKGRQPREAPGAPGDGGPDRDRAAHRRADDVSGVHSGVVENGHGIIGHLRNSCIVIDCVRR